jgi:hypothetical protein
MSSSSLLQTGLGFLKDTYEKHKDTIRNELVGKLKNVAQTTAAGTFMTGTVPPPDVHQMHFGMQHLQLVDSLAKKRSPRSHTTRRSKRRNGARK